MAPSGGFRCCTCSVSCSCAAAVPGECMPPADAMRRTLPRKAVGGGHPGSGAVCRVVAAARGRRSRLDSSRRRLHSVRKRIGRAQTPAPAVSGAAVGWASSEAQCSDPRAPHEPRGAKVSSPRAWRTPRPSGAVTTRARMLSGSLRDKFTKAVAAQVWECTSLLIAPAAPRKITRTASFTSTLCGNSFHGR